MISFGSKKSKGKKNILQVGNDNKSLDSNEIKNLKDLKNIEEYNKRDLENIAKIFNIGISFKDNGGKRILYKKEELYLKIKEKLENK